MGNCLRRIKRLPKKTSSEKIITLLIVGLDNAGKTLILNHIKGDPDKQVLPTMGFHTVCLKYKSYIVKIYDLGGSSQLRSLWSKYYGDIHGLIYVVDASDISRLTENKVIFGELVAHENISGKPLLLLANKQDLSGAIDELDIVDNLNVECVVNSTRCPTRVETCSCFYEKAHAKSSTLGITNGYKWLLDTILKNYTALNNRVKTFQNSINIEPEIRRVPVVDSPSRLSVHSNPFKPIRELLSKKEEKCTTSSSHNGIVGGNYLRKIFISRKTAPLSSENLFDKVENIPLNDHSSTAVAMNQQYSGTIRFINSLNTDSRVTGKRQNLIRPHTAPGCSRFTDTVSVINIPGQVPQ